MSRMPRIALLGLVPSLALLGCELGDPFGSDEIDVDVDFSGHGGGVVVGRPDEVGLACTRSPGPPGEAGRCSSDFMDAGAGGFFHLDAAPDSVSIFGGWSGDCVGMTCTLSFPPGQDTTFRVTARFILRPPDVTIESPVEGATYFDYEAVLFSGGGVDAAGNSLTGEHVWTSSRDGRLCDLPSGCPEFFRPLSPGSHRITLTMTDADGTADSASVDITVLADPGTASISGRVTVNGIGVAGVTLDLGGAASGTTTTDANGAYAFPGVPAGSYTVTLSAVPGATFPALSQAVTVAVGEAATVDFAGTNTAPTATITSPTNGQAFDLGVQIAFAGSATDPEDGALTGNALAWTSSVAGAIGTGESFSRTLSAGTHTITLTASDLLGATGSSSVDITVTDPNPTASISGRVTGNGNSVVGATLTLTGPVSRTTTSGSGGSYSFTMLPAGTYTISVSVDLDIGFPANPQTVTLAQGEAATVDFAGVY